MRANLLCIAADSLDRSPRRRTGAPRQPRARKRRFFALHDGAESFAQVLRVEQFAEADGELPAQLVLVAGTDAAAGGADGLAARALVEAFLFHVIGENDVGVIADDEIVADRDAGLAQIGHFLQETRRIDDDAVADHRRTLGRNTPVGRSDSLKVCPPLTTVCPALAPPL